MAIVILIVLFSLIGIWYGIKKQDKKAIIISVSVLILLAIALLIYLYLYSKNPY
ncbi:MAG: hypothetical protein PHH51_03140 [Bacilli bacterium]|nr:hypothetical protein [Bacilli bacterium]MDD3896005.1 hypothetical protein [Bacilli bacterium]MDD4407929.1 hypothetical protein [Bacilli bacterium]